LKIKSINKNECRNKMRLVWDMGRALEISSNVEPSCQCSVVIKRLFNLIL